MLRWVRSFLLGIILGGTLGSVAMVAYVIRHGG
jgi:biotin transporter BioY